MAQIFNIITARILCVLATGLLYKPVQCVLSVEPADLQAPKGSTVVLPCSTNLTRLVLWMYRSAGGDSHWVFLNQVLSSNSRFHIASEASGNNYNLTIRDVQLEDAGTYRCIDDEGYGHDLFLEGIPNNEATAKLSILGSDTSLLSENCTSGYIPHGVKQITGVAVVDDMIFVVGYNQSNISVYNSSTLTPLPDIEIPGNEMKSHEWLGLAGCNHNKVLYIGDDDLKYIHRIDVRNNSVINSYPPGWYLEENHLPHGLSVTAEHTLLVTVWIRNTDFESWVIEYTTKGELKNRIRLQEIKQAYHALKLSSDRFIVSQIDGSFLQRVCLVNTEGKILKYYGREPGGGEGELNGPYSLAICDKGQHVCVTDLWNNRVQVLDTNLTYRGQVQTGSYHLRYPARLCFDPSTNRLLVGENDSGHVVVISPPA